MGNYFGLCNVSWSAVICGHNWSDFSNMAHSQVCSIAEYGWNKGLTWKEPLDLSSFPQGFRSSLSPHDLSAFNESWIFKQYNTWFLQPLIHIIYKFYKYLFTLNNTEGYTSCQHVCVGHHFAIPEDWPP